MDLTGREEQTRGARWRRLRQCKQQSAKDNVRQERESSLSDSCNPGRDAHPPAPERGTWSRWADVTRVQRAEMWTMQAGRATERTGLRPGTHGRRLERVAEAGDPRKTA
jgi:hypothetical protein